MECGSLLQLFKAAASRRAPKGGAGVPAGTSVSAVPPDPAVSAGLLVSLSRIGVEIGQAIA